MLFVFLCLISSQVSYVTEGATLKITTNDENDIINLSEAKEINLSTNFDSIIVEGPVKVIPTNAFSSFVSYKSISLPENIEKKSKNLHSKIQKSKFLFYQKCANMLELVRLIIH